MPDLTVTAPDGAHFEFDEVKTARGEKSLGEVPILVWDDLEKAAEFYGVDSILAILDGTSLRVSFQGIARRMAVGEKTADDIAKAQVEFRPGKRQVGASTPESRARRAAAAAVEKSGNADAITALLQKIAAGEISADDLQALVGT